MEKENRTTECRILGMSKCLLTAGYFELRGFWYGRKILKTNRKVCFKAPYMTNF